MKETLLSLAELLQACGLSLLKICFGALIRFLQCFEGYESACKQAPPQVTPWCCMDLFCPENGSNFLCPFVISDPAAIICFDQQVWHGSCT